MNEIVATFERFALWAVAAGSTLAVAMMLAVIVGRIVLAVTEAQLKRIERRFRPLLTGALAGDEAARRALVESPRRYRLMIARLLIAPLIADRDPRRIAVTREIVRSLSLERVTHRFLTSSFWWRRALALRAVGLVQERNWTAAVVAALEDVNADVRDAALDALADMQDPAALKAIVVHLHNATLDRERRAAAISAFGAQCEGFLLDLAQVDRGHRLNYARALAICGTSASRPALCDWTRDRRADVRTAAFQALAQVGLDEQSAALAIAALESPDAAVRAVAASALHGWTGNGHAVSHLGRHLDDAWPVAVRAARSLQSMQEPGLSELQSHAGRPDLAGTLARQMLWEAEVHG